ncbi:hypothetical protein SASPL_112919 [Salvia splendens]|uniref:Proline-tRNA ligase class II C-terminal domain-containing protein n=1 Tax=Salvia splendens TaxID=180675 RepID=A0A8X9A5S8_SALSN|nr:hypothetical protein SASPL_112919 [Salvia splendens]
MPTSNNGTLRSREGHTAFATKEEADADVLDILELYRREHATFASGLYTSTVLAVRRDNSATSDIPMADLVEQEVEKDVMTRTKGEMGAAKSLCSPLEQPALPEGTLLLCFASGEPATKWTYWGRRY